jgi:hypothetical protein
MMDQHANDHSMPDLQRVRYITQNYRELQGLKSVPFSLLFLLWGAFDAGWLKVPAWLVDSPLVLLLILGSIGLAIALTKAIEGYYERRFGRIEPDPERTRRKRRWALISMFSWFIVIVLHEAFQLPLSVFLLTTGAFWVIYMFLYDWPNRRFMMHHITAMLLFIGISLLLSLGVIEQDNSTPLLVATGLILLIIDIIDHVLLVRTLKPVPEDSYGTDF